MNIDESGEIRLLVCVSHLFRVERLKYLSEVLFSLYGLDVSQLDVTVFTDASEPKDLTILERLFSKFGSSRMTVAISSHPEVAPALTTLPWIHKTFMKERHLAEGSSYTHYLYLEDDMLFSQVNLTYFMDFRAGLRSFGLIPGLVRYEYNETEHDIFTAGQLGRQDFLHKTRVICGNIDFIGLDEPYAAMFILDREMMDEYISSRSFDSEASASVVGWGSVQRAAMGLTWENVPPGFHARQVVPLRSGTTVPDAMCWVRHLPGRYTNDYSSTPNFILGKTPMDGIFTLFDDEIKQPAYVSCYSAADTPSRSISFVDQLYPAESYQRAMPVVDASPAFKDQLKRVCDSVNYTCSSVRRSILVRLSTIYLLGPVIYVEVDGRLALLFETYRPNDRGFVAAPHPRTIIGTSTLYQSDPETLCLFVGSAGSFNYGHWLVDDLPRLKAAYALRAKFPARRIRILFSLLGDVIDAVRRDCAEIYLSSMSDYSIEFLDHRVPYEIHDLFYASPVSVHPSTKSPAAIAWVAEQVVFPEARKQQPDGGSSRVFVTRRPPDSRTLLNHQEIAEFLSSHGFIVVDLVGLSFAQQLEIFRQAKVVVGCMGAGMTNTILSTPSIVIVMLAPEGWIEPFYWDLAAVRHDKYAVCYGEPNNKNVAANASSYTIDIGRLASLMDDLGLLEHGAGRSRE